MKRQFTQAEGLGVVIAWYILYREDVMRGRNFMRISDISLAHERVIKADSELYEATTGFCQKYMKGRDNLTLVQWAEKFEATCAYPVIVQGECVQCNTLALT